MASAMHSALAARPGIWARRRTMARAAVAYVRDNAIVFLDTNAATQQVAIELRQKLRFRVYVITNSGGPVLRRFPRLAFAFLYGAGAEREFAQILRRLDNARSTRKRPRYAFIDAVHLDPARGIACKSAAEARMKSLLLAHAEKIFILADACTLNSPGLADGPAAAQYPPAEHWASFPESWTLITTDAASAAALKELRGAGATEIVIAD
ncbi:DNA-binding transcriptional regulator of sugar metabolism, DeoR/GlpR family [Actinobaculum suis]|uniref:DNA-binding transcriptional regulator of sugar metabolism, DeoR/GlpR family n=1 Tax=Actinobaculum suis TaxID=1657 RepID=A0A1G7DVZ0_9ACTO|nr:hypothetical protein [Actinobaculum suis]MDY5152894.1 hypothetical protein [Actinobaculum suis]SDE55667.1 DNA-binding transcriptional regulator of sugar metabolism, DeoR/GlpR family [Actinobaculum suis]